MNPGQRFRGRDQAAAVLLVERIDKLNAHRLAMIEAGRGRDAVVAADQIHGLLDLATHEQLRAAVVQLTTPELRPALPVVVGRCDCGVMSGGALDRRATCLTHGDLEQAYRDSPGFRERGL